LQFLVIADGRSPRIILPRPSMYHDVRFERPFTHLTVRTNRQYLAHAASCHCLHPRRPRSVLSGGGGGSPNQALRDASKPSPRRSSSTTSRRGFPQQWPPDRHPIAYPPRIKEHHE